VKRWRYSRWDGAQPEFSLDAEQALDALSELLMEGLGVDEALEWLRQSGFELAGMDFRVMGVEELLRELQQQARELLGRYDLRGAASDLAQRLEALLQREERAQREVHGLESEALGRFLARRHGEYSNLSDAIEAFRGHDFADAEAGRNRSFCCAGSATRCATPVICGAKRARSNSRPGPSAALAHARWPRCMRICAPAAPAATIPGAVASHCRAPTRPAPGNSATLWNCTSCARC